ncbi:MAG: cytochrome C biogenesis protein CcdA [Boseongicola sp.]|nr:MAG: cytochrome C biogenesis protein CcdA [Boseongicola sp.]
MIRILAAICLLASGPAFAVEPEEILADPVLEERARDLSKGLRCLVCRNESIDESNAELARDLRLLVRERLLAGDTDDEAIGFIVARYGEYVLLNPRATGVNLLLWGAGPLMLLFAGAVAVAYVRKRRTGTEEIELSSEEKERLAALIKD